jgi:hypothetical protein
MFGMRLTEAPLLWATVARYGLAPVVIAIALATRFALNPVLQDEAPYLFFVPAVLVAASLDGLGPGLFATALGIVLGSFFAAPASPISVQPNL